MVGMVIATVGGVVMAGVVIVTVGGVVVAGMVIVTVIRVVVVVIVPGGHKTHLNKQVAPRAGNVLQTDGHRQHF